MWISLKIFLITWKQMCSWDVCIGRRIFDHQKWATSENTIILFVCPPTFCISIVSSFSWDLQWSGEKTKNNAYAKFGGGGVGRGTKSIMVFFRSGLLKMAFCLRRHFNIPLGPSLHRDFVLRRVYVTSWPISFYCLWENIKISVERFSNPWRHT